jgi:N-acetylmuramoyl-L-alanine amidase
MNLILFSLISILPYKYEITCENRMVTVESEKIEFQSYIPLKPIADLLRITYILDHNTQRLYLTQNAFTLEVVGGIGLISCNGVEKHLPFAPLFIGEDVYFPTSELITVIGGTFEKLVFMKELKEAPPIRKISVSARGDSAVITFDWEKPISFDVQFFMKSAVIELDGKYKDEKFRPLGSLKKIDLLPYNTYTRLELDLDGVNAYLERDNEVLFYHKITHRVAVIVIDPGHGGVDPGAVGKMGLYEKDANLEIAQNLQKLISDSLDVKVVMTREKDMYLSLKARTNIANRNSADLFLSIHCNASAKKAKMTGFETYFLSEAKTNEARAVAARENASLEFDGVEPSDAVSFILYDLAQSAYLEESNRFAEYIQECAEENLSIPSRGVKQAGFYVLRGAFMPSALVECAFVSDIEEEKLLKTKAFRKKLAQSIFKGVCSFIEDYERRLNN